MKDATRYAKETAATSTLAGRFKKTAEDTASSSGSGFCYTVVVLDKRNELAIPDFLGNITLTVGFVLRKRFERAYFCTEVYISDSPFTMNARSTSIYFMLIFKT